MNNFIFHKPVLCTKTAVLATHDLSKVQRPNHLQLLKPVPENSIEGWVKLPWDKLTGTIEGYRDTTSPTDRTNTSMSWSCTQMCKPWNENIKDLTCSKILGLNISLKQTVNYSWKSAQIAQQKLGNFSDVTVTAESNLLTTSFLLVQGTRVLISTLVLKIGNDVSSDCHFSRDFGHWVWLFCPKCIANAGKDVRRFQVRRFVCRGLASGRKKRTLIAVFHILPIPGISSTLEYGTSFQYDSHYNFRFGTLVLTTNSFDISPQWFIPSSHNE